MKRFWKCPAARWLLLCTLLVTPALAGAQAAGPPIADWTLMVYLDADNDLEKPMMRNLEEMVAVGSTDKVQIIVLAARSPESTGKYTNIAVGGLPDWQTAKYLRVERGRLRELADWGDMNMGDGETLAKFLAAATHDYPARRYGLIFGDHGMAWAGLAVAESHQSDALTVDEVTAALADIQKTTGRFELIGFDACLMANLEVAKTFAPYARYLVASEEIEPADGWDYRPLLRKLTASPSMDGNLLGRAIVDTYRDYFVNSKVHELQEKARAVTLTLVDLDKVAAVERAVEGLGTGVNALIERRKPGAHDAWVQLAQARHAAEEFGRSAHPPLGGVSQGMEVYDLVQIADNIRHHGQDPASAAAADAVIAAVGQAVVYEYRGNARPHAHGLSVFFPPNQRTLLARDKNGKKAYDGIGYSTDKNNRWYPFLSNYAGFPTSPEERNRPKPVIDPLAATGRMASPSHHVKISSQVHSDEVEDVSFVLSRAEGDSEIIIGAIPVKPDAAGDLTEEWDGEWFTITDQHLEFIAPITGFEELSDEGGEDMYWATVPAQLRIAGTRQWLDVTLSFVLDFRDDSEDVSGDFIYAVEYTRHGPREIDIEEGDDLRLVYEVIDADGNRRLQPVEGVEHEMHLHELEDLKVERSRVPPGTYQVGFVVEDFAGRVSENFVAVEVE